MRANMLALKIYLATPEVLEQSKKKCTCMYLWVSQLKKTLYTVIDLLIFLV